MRGLQETPDGDVAAEAAEQVRDLAESAAAVLIGPGMTGKESTRGFTDSCSSTSTAPSSSTRWGWPA